LLVPEVRELADLALLILGIAINQGGNEHDFSDFKIKRTPSESFDLGENRRYGKGAHLTIVQILVYIISGWR
jgi:hypothetical protein